MLRKNTRDIHDAETSLKKIAAHPLPPPPGVPEKGTTPIQPRAENDGYAIIKNIFDKDRVEKTPAEITEIYGYLFGNTKDTLSGIHAHACENINASIARFTRQQPLQQNEDERVTSYRAAINQALVSRQEEQNQAIERSINSEMKALASDEQTAIFADIIQKYLAARYARSKIYEQVGAALYNGAWEYYRSRWTVSHDNYTNLKNECTTFNAIFKGIAQVNNDFTISPIKYTMDTFTQTTPEEMQTLITNVITQARNSKLDDQKIAFSLLIGQLSALNGENDETQNSKGIFFDPIKADDKKLKFAFHDNVLGIINDYRNAQSRLDMLNAESLGAVEQNHKQIRARVKESANNVNESLEQTLQVAQNNSETFQTLLRAEAEIKSDIERCLRQMQPIDASIHALRTPVQVIQQIGLPQQADAALTAAFESGALGRKKAITETAGVIHKNIARLHDSIAGIIADADNTAESLQPIQGADILAAKKNELAQMERQITQLQTSVTEAKRVQLDANALLDHIQRALIAAQKADGFYQDLINSKENINFFDENGPHLFNHAEEMIAALKSHELYSQLPNAVKIHVRDTENSLAQTRQNFAAIQRCHLLLNCILNFTFWKSNRNKNIAVIAHDQPHSVPSDIFALIEIIKQPQYQHWDTDPEIARRMLSAIQLFADNYKGKSGPIKALLDTAAHRDDALQATGSKNNINRKMFLQPLRRIDPQQVYDIRKKPSFWERHPIAKQVLRGIFWTLAALCIVAVGVGIAMAFPPAAALLTGLAVSASAAVGGTAVFGTLLGIAGAAVLSIGAGIGYLVGKFQFKRQQRQAAAANAQFAAAPASRQNNMHRSNPLRPPMPSYAPSNPTTVMDGSVSTSRYALNQPASNRKKMFEQELVNEIITRYSGNPGESNFDRVKRAKLEELWAKCKNNLHTFLSGIKVKYSSTAISTLHTTIQKLNDNYPGVIETYPRNSILRQMLEEGTLSKLHSQHSTMRSRN